MSEPFDLSTLSGLAESRNATTVRAPPGWKPEGRIKAIHRERNKAQKPTPALNAGVVPRHESTPALHAGVVPPQKPTPAFNAGVPRHEPTPALNAGVGST